ncbi:hypothetical protein RFI_01157 [Reticulomyxa filosa]|uniref:Uncharacterized protein n=1 Tax=Reticulomyxa filosa TaxID=46433 RepID=X6PCY3_RETFI|nr:hypothetical protein RFI_01157 [Reticulomyxa filosa]|eukprot:ETO35904.1 hypothetical protein RFI_01157 [Reticulomyxa filosa]
MDYPTISYSNAPKIKNIKQLDRHLFVVLLLCPDTRRNFANNHSTLRVQNKTKNFNIKLYFKKKIKDDMINSNHFSFFVEKKKLYTFKNILSKKSLSNAKKISTQQALVKEVIQVILQYWIRVLQVKFGWINELEKFSSIMLVHLYFLFKKITNKNI